MLNPAQRAFLTWIRDNVHFITKWDCYLGLEVSGDVGSARIEEPDQAGIRGMLKPSRAIGCVYTLTPAGHAALGATP
jgi:hypothetical protein